MEASTEASTLLTKLETYDFTSIFTPFVTYLQPFSPYISPKPQNPNKKPSRSKKTSQPPSIRSLAKTFLPFINRSLSLLPKRLSETPKHEKTAEFATELLDCYNLCLDCLDVLASELSGKPYSAHLQRGRYVHCLMRWERYGDGVNVGFRVLKEIGEAKVGGKGWKVSMGELVPVLEFDGGDGNRGVEGDVVHLIVDLAVAIAQCVALSKVKDAGNYDCLLVLLREVQPWFRHLESCARTKLQWKLLNHLKNVAVFLIKEASCFNGDLVPRFCEAIFDWYRELLNDQSQQRTAEEELQEFVKFVSNCTYKCRSACKSVRISIAMQLYESAGKFSQELVGFISIQRLYALGLYFSEFRFESNSCFSSATESLTSASSTGFLPEGWVKLQHLSTLLSCGKNYHISNPEFCEKSPSHGFCAIFDKKCICSNFACKAFKSNNGEAYQFLYLDALKFLCWPFAEFVTSERKRIVTDDKDSSLGIALKLFLEAFFEYSYLFSYCQQNRDSHVEIDMIVVNICMAAFTLSLKFNLSEGSPRLIDVILSDKCFLLLRPQMWKYIIAMLHNNFVEFYRHKRLKEALEALDLCCRASWTRCLLFTEILTGKQKGFDGELSENMTAESLNEADKVNSLLMDVFHEIDSCKVEIVTKFGLEKWCLARNLFWQLPCPVVLIKSWAKIHCKLYKNIKGNAPILGNYLLGFPCMASRSISIEAVGIFLEQELLVYQEMSPFYPMFCQRMQLEIVDVLLQKVYYSSNFLQRSITLVKKGILLRTLEEEGLTNCLSDAIETINGSCGMPHDISDRESNQLAVAYFLRALSTHEDNPASKDVFEDIRIAVKLLKTDVPGCSSSFNFDMGCDYVLLLLYHVADLLSIKGDMTLHSDLLNVIIKVFKQMKISLKKCLLLLWESRRVNHALCAVPVNEALVTALSEHYGEDAESLDFWISSLKDSMPLLAGFQQNFSFLSSLFPLAFHQLQDSLQPEISVDEVKEFASNLISIVPVSRSSAFLAGYLYHDLSERLIVGGRTIEALFCAKEAHRLRGKLLQEYFSYSLKQHEVINEEHGEIGRKSSACVHQFSVLNHVAVGHWPSKATSQDSDGLILTPWNVLRCYLESTLQVGIIHERLGNFPEAEAQFIFGKSISCLQSLSRFSVIFSFCLGKVYDGRSLLDLAQNELVSSMQALAVERDSLTCSRCLLVFESYINEQLGNLSRNDFTCASENPYETSLRSLSFLDKDDFDVCPEGASAVQPMSGVENYVNAVSETRTDCNCVSASSGISSLSNPTKTKAKSGNRRSKKVKEVETLVTGKSNAAEQNARVTRSRKLPSHAKKTDLLEGGENVTNSYSNSQMKSKTTIACTRICCQKCFSRELKPSGPFTSFIRMKWEFFRRRLILRLLVGLGNSQEALLGTHSLHTIYAKCLSILLGGNDCHCSSSTPLNINYIGMEVQGDILAGELAEVLYYLCWFSSKALFSEDVRSSCCELCCIQLPHIISFLKLSFVLSREVPLLFQKVSRLLSLIHVVSASRKNLLSLSSTEGLSENHWAAYFHQASVGNHHNLQLLSAIGVKRQSLTVSKKGSEVAVARCMIEDTCTLLRMVPESTAELESYVLKFFENLPSTTIVCMSLLGDSYAGLLKEVMSYPSVVPGWLLLSHLNADSPPAVLLLPLNTVLQDEGIGSSCPVFGEENVQKEWCSPWGCNTVIDDVAPLFKSILRANYLSCSSFPEEHTERSRKAWWTCRDNLDKSLQKFLQDMEETWFGQWKFMLLGQWLDSEPLNCVVKDLINDRKKDGSQRDLSEGILKVVMGGIKLVDAEKLRIPKLFLEKGCYIGSILDCDGGRSNALDAYDAIDHVSDSLIAALNKVELEYCTRREPVVLVLDTNVQMLPLENMPIMREQEVYRMPSITSILVALQRKAVLDEAAKVATKFPLIDPLDAFYLLNPSGDLSRTQNEFEEWFRHQNIQGKAGVVPSSEELSAALESRDLFLYFGHGSGAQYIPRDKIQKLESCAAVLLMGCSSGSLNLNGCYAPVGTSLSYMFAGAPIVVANLWEVTDLDIDRFAKVVLKSFMEERSMSSTGCIQCSLLAEELNTMTVKEKKGTKKGRGRKKTVDPTPDDIGEYCFRHKLRAGYFVSQARKACKLPFLIGAAPVCYGVPTGIRNKQMS